MNWYLYLFMLTFCLLSLFLFVMNKSTKYNNSFKNYFMKKKYVK